MTTINATSTQTAHIEDTALEVFLAAAGDHDATVRDYLDQVKANSETRKKIRTLQNLISHMESLRAEHGDVLARKSGPGNPDAAGPQKDWNDTRDAINELIASSPYIQEQLGAGSINHMPFDEAKTKLENAASNLGDLGQELQQRMSHAVSLASRHYELGSTVLKKFHETSAAIIRNI